MSLACVCVLRADLRDVVDTPDDVCFFALRVCCDDEFAGMRFVERNMKFFVFVGMGQDECVDGQTTWMCLGKL